MEKSRRKKRCLLLAGFGVLTITGGSTVTLSPTPNRSPYWEGEQRREIMRHILFRSYGIGVLILLAVGGVLFASTASAQVPGTSTRLSTATAGHQQEEP